MSDRNRKKRLPETRHAQGELPERSSEPSKATGTTLSASKSSMKWPKSPPTGASRNPFPSASNPKADPKWNPKGSSVDHWEPKGGPKKITGSVMVGKQESDTSSKALSPNSKAKSTEQHDKDVEEAEESESERETLASPSFISLPRSERAFRDKPVDPDWAPSVHTFSSEPVLDLQGDRRWYQKKTNTRKHQELVQSIENSKWYDNPYRILMLDTGQGGTFGFGDRYMTETGEWVTRRDARNTDAKIKHLDCWGRNMSGIGTQSCVTCLGVYFELRHNRVFAAHINAWHSACTWNEPHLVVGSSKWWDIKDAVGKRMRQHAAEHAWTKHDVIPGTVSFCSPMGYRTGWAMLRAVCQDFLELPDCTVETKAHGFVLIPGQVRLDGRQRGYMLEAYFPWEHEEDHLIHFAAPNPKWEIYHYTNDDGDYPSDWTYTVNVGWHAPTLDRGRFEFLHHGLHELEGTPVYPDDQQ